MNSFPVSREELLFLMYSLLCRLLLLLLLLLHRVLANFSCCLLLLLLQLFREALLSQDFQEIHTPKLIAGASEGGAAVFRCEGFLDSVISKPCGCCSA
jgi:hypothetical protein